MIRIKIIILLCFVGFLKVKAQDDYPVLTEIVTDNAQIFSEEELLQLKTKLIAYEAKTTNQIVVLTIPRLGDDTVENYAFQTFNLDKEDGNKNQFGQKGVDNGILILVSRDDRKVRIEVGDGLTPIITDLYSSRIIRNSVVPFFKEQLYYQGIDNATSEIINLIDNPEYNPEYRAEFVDSLDKESDSDIGIITRFFLSFVLLHVMVMACFFIFFSCVKYIPKNIIPKIKLLDLFLNNKIKFLTTWFLVICVAAYFYDFTLLVFTAFVSIALFFVLIGVGLFLLLKLTYQRATAIFVALFSGELGIFAFPFYLPGTLLFLFAGILFTFLPLIMGGMFIVDNFFGKSINVIMSGVEPLHVVFFILMTVLLFLIVTAVVAISKIKKSYKKSFSFSFFKNDISLPGSMEGSSPRGYSSSGSSSYSSGGSSSYSSSSSSSSSFSGGGGSSSGGGASGSW